MVYSCNEKAITRDEQLILTTILMHLKIIVLSEKSQAFQLYKILHKF